VAVDSEVRNTGGNLTTVRQPLPLPEGVSNYAVGTPVGKAAYSPSMVKTKRAANDMMLFEAESDASNFNKEVKEDGSEVFSRWKACPNIRVVWRLSENMSPII